MVRAVAVDEHIGPGTHGCRLGGPAVKRVQGVPGAFALVLGGEAAAREGEQLGLQVAGDHVDDGTVGRDAAAERGPAHRGDGAAVVADLHRNQPVGKGSELLDLGQG